MSEPTKFKQCPCCGALHDEFPARTLIDGEYTSPNPHPVVLGLLAIVRAHGLHQQLATYSDAAGVSRSLLYSWLNRGSVPRIDNIDALLGVFDFELAIRRKIPSRYRHRIEPVEDFWRTISRKKSRTSAPVA